MSAGWLYWSPRPGFTIAWSGRAWLPSYDRGSEEDR